MPTENGSETIGEALTRLRIALSRVDKTIERAEDNGQTWGSNDHSVTEIAHSRAVKRACDLRGEISVLENRMLGRKVRRSVATISHRS